MVNFYCRIHPLFVDFPSGLWRAYAYFISWTEEELCPSLPPPPFIDGTNSYIFFFLIFFSSCADFFYMQSLHNQESLTRWSICSLGQAGSGSVTHNGIRSHNVQDLTGGLLPVVAEMIVIVVVGVSQVTFEFRNARRVIINTPRPCWYLLAGGRER